MSNFKQTRNFWNGLGKAKTLHSLNMNSAPAIVNVQTPPVLLPKPKYNTSYLISKGNKLTRNNRTKVRVQQLRNYIKNSSNPVGVKSAQNEIQQLGRVGGKRKTRRNN